MFAIVQWSVPDIFFPLGVIPDIMPICRASYEVMTPSGDTDLNEPWNTVLHKSNERVRTLMHNAAVPFVYKQSPIQSQFEQSLLTVQNAAQRTFSLLFPLLRLGRSAQVSCAVRGPFVISSLRMDLYLSELYHHLCDLQSVWVWGKNYLPNPKTGK